MSETEAPTVIKTTAPKLDDSPIPSAIPPTEKPILTDKKPIDTPPPSVKTTTDKSNILYTSPNINFEDDPNTYLKTKFESLIYWEYPKKSAAFLGGSLGILVLTQYYSVLQIIAGLFTLATGINLLYVNLHKQSQRFISGKSGGDIVNPHSQRLGNKGTYIPRDRVLKTAQLTIDVVEVLSQEATKLVLVEDSWRSAISIVLSYLVWTLAKFVPTKYLVGLFVVSAFSVPRLYLQHKEVVDAQVAQQTENARILAEKYGTVAATKVKELTTQAKSLISKSPVSVPTPKETVSKQD